MDPHRTNGDDALPGHIDATRLVVRNLPADFRAAESRQLLALFGATKTRRLASTPAHRSTVLAEFPTSQAARSALRFLHQRCIDGCVLRVEFARRAMLQDDAEAAPMEPALSCGEAPAQLMALDAFVAELNATAGEHLAQPPPPHLR